MDRGKLRQSIVTGLVVLGIVGMTTMLGEPRGFGGNWCGTPLFSQADLRSVDVQWLRELQERWDRCHVYGVREDC